MIKTVKTRTPPRPLAFGDRVQRGEHRGKVRTLYTTRTGEFAVVDWSDGRTTALRPSLLRRY